jgi:antitoxin MazE
MQVSKWGNSLAIRLPAALVEVLDLKPGDEIDIRIAGDRDFVVGREPSRRELIDRVRKLSAPLPRGFRFDRDEANAR